MVDRCSNNVPLVTTRAGQLQLHFYDFLGYDLMCGPAVPTKDLTKEHQMRFIGSQDIHFRKQ